MAQARRALVATPASSERLARGRQVGYGCVGMAGRIDTATRVIHASPRAVADAFAAPERMMAWLPPKGMTGRALDFDYREGGRYQIELTYEAGGTGKTSATTDIAAGRFVKLEPARIVMSVEFASADPAFADEMMMSWTFEPVPGGTQVTVVAEHVPAGISADDHAAALASTLTNLARCVEAA